MKIKRVIFGGLGLFFIGLGAVGAALPLLPTVPFLFLAAICFGRSSEKLDTWFKGTKLYKNNLESFVQGLGMTKKSKAKCIASFTIVMGLGFYFMGAVPVGRIALALVWVGHMIYFLFRVKTIDEG